MKHTTSTGYSPVAAELESSDGRNISYKLLANGVMLEVANGTTTVIIGPDMVQGLITPALITETSKPLCSRLTNEQVWEHYKMLLSIGASQTNVSFPRGMGTPQPKYTPRFPKLKELYNKLVKN